MPSPRSLSLLVLLAFVAGSTATADAAVRKRTRNHRSTKVVSKRLAKAKKARVKRMAWVPLSAGVKVLHAAYIAGGPWTEPTFADVTAGDHAEGEDLNVRQAAIAALNGYNGAVVVVDPETGRILTMVNQKLTLGDGCQPCSTIKVPIAMAALSESLVGRDTQVHLYGRTKVNLTNAMARSNNYYFANLGIQLGYQRVAKYAKMFGYGELAGLNIPGERPGYFPPAAPANGGMGMLSSFGEEIRQTPLQLAALMSALANGGTLHYLQHPQSQAEAAAITPQVKRHLTGVKQILPDLLPGLLGTVEFGSGRRAGFEGIAGKTGTCTEGSRHLGWFGSFGTINGRQLAVVVMLTGGRPSVGSTASGIAGDFYRRLRDSEQVASNPAFTPATLLAPLVK